MDQPATPPPPPPEGPGFGWAAAGQTWPTDDARRHRRENSWIGGAILIGIGVAFLLGQLIPDAGNDVVLAIGLTFFAAFFVTREYGFLVPAGIVSGVGAGIVLDAAVPGVEGGSLFMLSMGSGFISIWVIGLIFRLRENHPWPLFPGIVLGWIGAVSLAGTRYADLGRLGFPIVLIAIGVLLVARGTLRRSGS